MLYPRRLQLQHIGANPRIESPLKPSIMHLHGDLERATAHPQAQYVPAHDAESAVAAAGMGMHGRAPSFQAMVPLRPVISRSWKSRAS